MWGTHLYQSQGGTELTYHTQHMSPLNPYMQHYSAAAGYSASSYNNNKTYTGDNSSNINQDRGHWGINSSLSESVSQFTQDSYSSSSAGKYKSYQGGSKKWINPNNTWRSNVNDNGYRWNDRNKNQGDLGTLQYSGTTWQNNHDAHDKSSKVDLNSLEGSWVNTMREDPEMNLSNRQRKRQMYSVSNQAWAQEDFFKRLPPADIPFGLKLLKGMGWRQGQAIGKSKEGHTAPIAVDVRMGRQGLCTREEKMVYDLKQGRPKPPKKTHPVKMINGKHPVSLLAECCMQRQLAQPKYDVVFEYGNFQSKSVLVSVTAGGKTFEPSEPSPYKKHSKAMAATKALEELDWLKKKE